MTERFLATIQWQRERIEELEKELEAARINQPSRGLTHKDLFETWIKSGNFPGLLDPNNPPGSEPRYGELFRAFVGGLEAARNRSEGGTVDLKMPNPGPWAGIELSLMGVKVDPIGVKLTTVLDDLTIFEIESPEFDAALDTALAAQDDALPKPLEEK